MASRHSMLDDGSLYSSVVDSRTMGRTRARERPWVGERKSMNIERITLNPAVMGGKPCIRGMRVTVSTILGLLATGKSRERILEAYPYLEPEDIDAALSYAAWRLEEREEPLVGALASNRSESSRRRTETSTWGGLDRQQ